MGVCQSTNKEPNRASGNKERKNQIEANKGNNDESLSRNNGNNEAKSPHHKVKGDININQIEIGMINDQQKYSPSKVVVADSPQLNQGARMKVALPNYVTCPNCQSRIPKIESIVYDSTQLTYVIKINCFCLKETKQYALDAFKSALVPNTTCESHQGQKLNFYCSQCSADLCQQCADQDHANHQITNPTSYPPAPIEELTRVLNEQKNNFETAYSNKEKEFNNQCDEIQALLSFIRENGNKHLKDYFNQNMNLFAFALASYSQYDAYENMNQLTVGMINLVKDLTLNNKWNPGNEPIEFKMSKAMRHLNNALRSQANDYSLSLNYDIFENKQINLKQYTCATTIQAHSNNVVSLILLNDGRLASGSYDQTIKLWDLSNENKCEVLFEKGNALSLLEFTPGKLLSGTSEKEIRLWDTTTKQDEFVFQGHCLWVNCLVKLNQELFASGSNDKTIRIWDFSARKYQRILKMHTDCILTMCLLTQNNSLVSGSADNSIRIWSTSEGTCTHWLKEHSKWVKCLCCLSSGKFLSGSDDHTIKVWEDSNCLRTLYGHQDSVRAICQISNQQFVSGSFDNSIKIWSVASYECEQTLMSHTSLVICLIPISNKSFASCSNDKTIKTWL